jgi:hypothetical protein
MGEATCETGGVAVVLTAFGDANAENASPQIQDKFHIGLQLITAVAILKKTTGIKLLFGFVICWPKENKFLSMCFTNLSAWHVYTRDLG